MRDLRLAARLSYAEGPAALRDRVLDRLCDATRRRSYRRVAPEELSGLAPVRVLTLLPTPPNRSFGGLQIQSLARLSADDTPHAILYPDGSRWRLEVDRHGQRVSCPLAGPRPTHTSLALDGFKETVRSARALVDAEAVHVESPSGLPLQDLLDLTAEMPVLLSCHDFGLFCPRPNLLEQPDASFCHYSLNPERCARCLNVTWRLPERYQSRRRAVARELLSSSLVVIYVSDFLRDQHLRLFAGLPSGRQEVVAPACPSRPPSSPSPRSPGRHFAFVGGGAIHRGALVFEQIVMTLGAAFQPSRWTVYGGEGSARLQRFRRLPKVHVRGYYRVGSLPELLARDGVDLVLLLSIVPESYSLAADECLLAGVPVVCFDSGAPGERIRRLGGGRTVPLAEGADGVVRLIESFAGMGIARLAPAPSLASDPSAVVTAHRELRRRLALA